MKNIIIVLLSLGFLLFTYRSCKTNTKTNDIIKIDTVEVVKYIPEIIKDTVFVNLQPKKTIKINDLELIKKLEIKHKKTIDSIIILKELVSALEVREYTKKLNDSIVDIEVKAITTGTLNELNIKYTKKKQQIKLIQKNKTTLKYHKSRVYLGFDSSFQESSINLSLQNKKGYIYELGYTTDSNVKIGVKIPLFTKY